ncbi:orofacial cleft 1 candidate gene 1 protein [Oryzias latipes]|uniref:Uncharacterized protein opo n=1 Tax=Oryzias latipes TaxID=8090 RepID=B0BK68_ORYLA|nr:orofacial cleft 1 candidate gene 1 protein [Oryzias latipes]CAP46911.1 hypothetical protein [Oryzias latipes]
MEMNTSDSKSQQKALQQPKQKKSKSAEFLMGSEESDTVVGIDNPAFDGEGSTELSIPSTWLGRKMRGDRPDSTLAAHHKKMELQAPAKERGNEHAQNYFDPSSAEQIDPRHHWTTGVNTKDELELTILNADENRLYERMAALLEDDDTSLDIPGTLQASRDDEVLEVKAGDLLLQRRLLLHSGGDASGSGPSQAHTTAKTRAKGGEVGLEAGRMEMGREITVKTRTAEEVIPHYAQQLRERVQPDMITLGSLSLQQQQAPNKPWKMTEWAKRKKRLASLFRGNSENATSPRDCDEAVRPQPKLNTLFPCAESPSVSELGGGQGDAKHGQMTAVLESSSLASRPPWPSARSSLPQPVEVRVCCLRATRDKLPRGLYSIRVTIHSRLGGSTLALFGQSKHQDWGTSTEPTEHGGRFYHNDLPINQSFFMNLPAACDITPSMVLVFQLINLAGHSSHVSSALSWGAFPICGPSFCLVQGKFKTPLLRGEPNQQMDQFKKIEAQIGSDLDNWLCNLYFQVKRLPPGASVQSELSVVAPNPPAIKPEIHEDQPQPRPPSQSLLCPQPESQTQLYAGPSCREEPVVSHSHQGSCLHLSADSACSSSSLPGKNYPLSGSSEERSDPYREGAEGGNHCKKKPIKKTNSCGPSMSGRSAPPRQADKQTTQTSTETLSAEDMEEYTFSLQSAPAGPSHSPPHLSDRVRIALCMLLSELDLPLLRQRHQQHLNDSWHDSVQQLGLIMLLLTLMWFVRLYLHYWSQWLYLQAIAVPVNKFRFHAHTVELVYQSSLLHTREELAMVMVGPLTLNAVTFLLVLIRWGCQLIFGSLPSFMSKFIMAQGVWTVLDPLAVFAVDAVLGHLIYSPDVPVGDAAKLYWHFYRADRSGAAGVFITLFLYAVHFLLSITILSIYLLRFHNDGRMLDVFQRLTAKEGKYFLPQDLELSNQELSYIVKKAEQWRGFNGERRKVAVYDYVWTTEDVLSSSGEEPHMEAPPPPPEGETSTHVIIYTLYVSGLKQRYRHFLRQPDGAIVEVIGEIDGDDNGTGSAHSAAHQKEKKESASLSIQLRKRRKPLGRFRRMEPLGGSGSGSSSAIQDLHE